MSPPFPPPLPQGPLPRLLARSAGTPPLFPPRTSRQPVQARRATVNMFDLKPKSLSVRDEPSSSSGPGEKREIVGMVFEDPKEKRREKKKRQEEEQQAQQAVPAGRAFLELGEDEEDEDEVSRIADLRWLMGPASRHGCLLLTMQWFVEASRKLREQGFGSGGGADASGEGNSPAELALPLQPQPPPPAPPLDTAHFPSLAGPMTAPVLTPAAASTSRVPPPGFSKPAQAASLQVPLKAPSPGPVHQQQQQQHRNHQQQAQATALSLGLDGLFGPGQDLLDPSGPLARALASHPLAGLGENALLGTYIQQMGLYQSLVLLIQSHPLSAATLIGEMIGVLGIMQQAAMQQAAMQQQQQRQAEPDPTSASASSSDRGKSPAPVHAVPKSKACKVCGVRFSAFILDGCFHYGPCDVCCPSGKEDSHHRSTAVLPPSAQTSLAIACGSCRGNGRVPQVPAYAQGRQLLWGQDQRHAPGPPRVTNSGTCVRGRFISG